MAVNRKLPGRAFFRAAFYVPAVTSAVVTSVIFLWIYSKPGLLNYFLSWFGVDGPDWIGSPKYALGAIMAMNVWSTSGFFMIAFLAGLAAGVWTKDVSAATRIASQLKAGTVWVNCHAMIDPALPFGGYKESGIGREQGTAGIEEFTQARIVNASLL